MWGQAEYELAVGMCEDLCHYSLAIMLWSPCSVCPAGYYGSAAGATSATCSGPCLPGYYGSQTNLTVSTCSGSCTGGYYCTGGATNGTQFTCPGGTYSSTAAANCTYVCTGVLRPHTSVACCPFANVVVM